MRVMLFAAMSIAASSAFAQVYVAPHVDRNGNYHQDHYRSAPDGNQYNNYSTRGNVNPYTGQPGTVTPQPYQSYQAPSYTPPPQPQQYMPRQYNAPVYQRRQSAY